MKYSQNNEEEFICNYFNQNNGFFLEIGAFDPKIFSNTRKLVEKGWGGVYVEPSPICAEKFKIEYKNNKNIILIEAAISDRNGTEKFYDSQGDAISSLNINHKTFWENSWDVNYKEIEVRLMSMDTLLKSINNKIDFLNIDVEGTNIDLFDLIPNEIWDEIKMLCIEHEGKQKYIEDKLNGFGLESIHTNGENIILAKSKKI